MTNGSQSISPSLRVPRQRKLRLVVVLVLCAQCLAAPLLFAQGLVPPVIGIGPFSFAVDYRYLQATLIGASAAILVWLPFVLAWSPKRMSWRAAVFVALLALVGAVIIAMMMITFAGAWGFGQISWSDWIRESSWPAAIAIVTSCGLAVAPTAIRVYRGWQVGRFADPTEEISRRDRLVESILLAVLIGAIVFGGPFVSGPPGFNMLVGVFAVVAGGILSVSAFWLFRASSSSAFRVVLMLHLFLFVAVPGACLWLADFYRTILLPAGSGGLFLGVAVAAMFLLLYVLLFRAMGFRMCRLPFEKSAAVPEAKVVVDPFSD